MPKPLVIELFAGLHGWGDGFAAEGYQVIGYDLHDMCKEIGYPRPNGDIELVLQDVRTVCGWRMRNAAVIVASPPCTDYAKWGMRMFHPNPPQPDLSLWQAAIRIADEAGVPLLIENVRGARYFWGGSVQNVGPYHLWGAVPLFPPNMAIKRKSVIDDVKNGMRLRIPSAADYGSKSSQRKRCTAIAARIPNEISRHVARCFKH